jgi:hypothetical protein
MGMSTAVHDCSVFLQSRRTLLFASEKDRRRTLVGHFDETNGETTETKPNIAVTDLENPQVFTPKTMDGQFPNWQAVIKPRVKHEIYVDASYLAQLAKLRNPFSSTRARGPAVVANEIRRRVLPAYVEVLNRAMESKQASDQRERQTQANCDQLATLLASKGYCHVSKEKDFIGIDEGDIKIRHDYITITVSVDTERAKIILDAVTATRKPGNDAD